MRQPSRPLFAGRAALASSRAGLPSQDATGSEQGIGIGHQQYREWQYERDELAEMIGEAELNLPASPGYLGPARELSSSPLSATYRRVERLERLMAEHAGWRQI